MNERNILRSFSKSDFCVKFYESMQDDENLYLGNELNINLIIVLEYLPGGELFALIK